ncbi:hypothetical protein JB92DRAFT_3124329 [Gautieria morchelliformis]|nr:hypothetical protein JB92DRAFT_3124329 [Gautieria morchelliformis]
MAAHDAIIEHRVTQTFHANKKRMASDRYAANDRVYLLTQNLTLLKGRARKLVLRYIGPYHVVEAHNDALTVTLDLADELKNHCISPVFHSSLVRRYEANNNELFPRPRDLRSLALSEITTTCTHEGPLTPEEMGNGRMLAWNKWGRLSDLRLVSLIYPNTALVLVDWLLGPRSLADLSHVETLRIVPQGDAVNWLLHTIGSSLKHLELRLPHKLNARHNFNFNVEFNPALKFLDLSSLDMTGGLATSRDLTRFLRFLSGIKASNLLEEIKLRMIVDKDTFRRRDCLAWKKVVKMTIFDLVSQGHCRT